MEICLRFPFEPVALREWKTKYSPVCNAYAFVSQTRNDFNGHPGLLATDLLKGMSLAVSFSKWFRASNCKVSFSVIFYE